MVNKVNEHNFPLLPGRQTPDKSGKSNVISPRQPLFIYADFPL
jgi:hypothetical protein